MKTFECPFVTSEDAQEEIDQAMAEGCQISSEVDLTQGKRVVDWSADVVSLNGEFSREQLLALLWFHPDEQGE
jgi:hypothetical protein